MKHLVFIFLLLITALGNTQENQKYNFNEVNLEQVIKQLEKEYEVSFSYAIDIIEDKTITLNVTDIGLEELLNYLEAQTSLSFERISKNQVIIAPKTVKNKICGYVLDNDSRIPIPFSEISSSTNEKTVSNENGFFVINGKENDIYTVNSQGYESKNFIGSKTCQQVYLMTNNEILDEIVVLGYVTSGIDRNKDGSINVTSKNLGILPGLVTPDLLQSIQLIPGIKSLDESASGIQIRGGTPDQNLILFDDIKLYNTGFFHGMFSIFNPYATRQATIYKSGTSAVYGDRISGILDISTGENIPDKSEGGFGIDGLSFDGYIRTPLTKNLAAYVFARRSYGDRQRTPTYVSYAEKIFRNFGEVRDANGQIIDVPSDDEYDIDTSIFDFSFHDINTKLIYAISDKSTVILSSIFTRNALEFAFNDDGETKADDLKTVNNGLSVKWKHQGSIKKSEEITFYISNYKSEYFNKETIDGTLDEITFRNNYITDIGLNLKAQRVLGEKHNLTFGYQLSNNNVDIEIIEEEQNNIDENINNQINNENLKNALFVEYKYNSTRASIISVGLRGVHYSSLMNFYFEPRLNLEYNISKALRIKGSLERRHQPISQILEFDIGELRLENNIWRLSDNLENPLLKSDQVSTGLLYDRKGWTADLDIYYKEISGLTSGTNGFRTPQIILDEGRSKIKGLDFLMKKRINNFRFWAGYTYNDIRFSFPNIQKDDFPGNNDVTHSFRFSSAWKINSLELSLGWQYRTGEPYTPIYSFDQETSLVDYGKINSKRLNNYHRLDASAIYNFKFNKTKNWTGQLAASALNLYNRKIPISYTYITEDEGSGLELQQVIQRFSLGFTPNLSFRLFFR